MMDPRKVEAVMSWEVPTSVKGVRGFLGFANFYSQWTGITQFGLAWIITFSLLPGHFRVLPHRPLQTLRIKCC